MRSLLFVLLVACGGGSKPSPTTVSNQPEQPPVAGSSQPMVATATRPVCGDNDMKCAVATFGFFTDQICACKDKACAEQVTNEVTAWGNEMAKKPGNDKKQAPEDVKVMTDLAQKYSDCMSKLYTDGSTPPPDPCGGGADPCGG